MSQPQRIEAQVDAIQHLSFRVREAGYALPIALVREIIEYAEVTRVPMMPAYIHGVINLRGNVVPVLDLAARFGLSLTEPGKRTCIVIVELELEGERQITGVVVDAVSAVLDIPASEIEPAPSFGTRIRGDFIGGMGKVNGKFVILLNVEQVLALDGLAVLPELAEAQAA